MGDGAKGNPEQKESLDNMFGEQNKTVWGIIDCFVSFAWSSTLVINYRTNWDRFEMKNSGQNITKAAKAKIRKPGSKSGESSWTK